VRIFGIGILLAVLLLSAGTSAQVVTGTPQFGSFGGGPFDVVNLGNLNVHFDIPVIQKAGRGSPYTFTMSYDNTVWSPVTSSGTRAWTAAPNYGWNFTVPQYAFGYTTAQTLSSWQQPCNPPNNNTPVYVTIYGDWAYVDAKGTRHAFPPSFTDSYQSITGCPGVNAPPTTGNSLAIDGSGYTIYVSGGNGSVVGPDGKGVNIQQTSSSTTDANGNQVTSVTGNNGTMQVTDTLGQNVLTVSGTNPVLLSYSAPGGTAAFTINYSSYNIHTNFGCSGLVDPTLNAQMLISSINLPDGTSYQFTYETNGSYYTGRLASITLPTLGSISYQYTGANGGVNCSDGSTIGLTRSPSPGGTWTYARTLSGQLQTTVTSPIDQANSPAASDVTVINFAEDPNGTFDFYETQRQVYQGSATGTPLATTTTCYNGNYSNCASHAASAPISQTDVYTQLGSGPTRLSEIVYNGNGLPTDDKEYNYGVTLNAAPSSAYLVRETSTSYGSYTGAPCAALGNGIVDTPCQVFVYDWSTGSKLTVASTNYTYDESTPATTSGTPQHTSITGSRGNLTTIATQANSSITLYRKLAYYDTGVLKTSSDLGTTSSGGPNLTTYNFSDATSTCGNAFPSGISEPGSLTRSFTWNCVGGVNLVTTDERNNNTTTHYADADFWRPDYSLDPLSNQTNFRYYTNPTATESYLTFGTSVSDSRTTVDDFGRVSLSQKAQTPLPSAYYDSSETDYNVFGQPAKETLIKLSAFHSRSS